MNMKLWFAYDDNVRYLIIMFVFWYYAVMKSSCNLFDKLKDVKLTTVFKSNYSSSTNHISYKIFLSFIMPLVISNFYADT